LGKASCGRRPSSETIVGELVHDELRMATEGVECLQCKPGVGFYERVEWAKCDDDPELWSVEARGACIFSIDCDGFEFECRGRHDAVCSSESGTKLDEGWVYGSRVQWRDGPVQQRVQGHSSERDGQRCGCLRWGFG
jgi:hypothetical protein